MLPEQRLNHPTVAVVASVVPVLAPTATSIPPEEAATAHIAATLAIMAAASSHVYPIDPAC